MSAPEQPPSSRARVYRRIAIGALIVLFVAVAVYVWQTGAVTATSIRLWLESLGPWGPVVFVGAFMAGSMVGLPGMAFVAGGCMAFGPWVGFAVGYVAGLAAVSAPFLVARLLRRNAAVAWKPKRPWLRRIYEQLDVHPLRAVILLRLVLWFNPPLSYALALTRVRYRDYILGCAIALAPVVAAGNLATDWFL